VESPDPGGIAPLFSGDGDVVVWNEFREAYEAWDDPLDFSEVYSGRRSGSRTWCLTHGSTPPK
jgi:hypothetical protein